MGGTYRAWNDKTYRWPPPDGWYRDDDGTWWAPGTGPRPPGRRAAAAVNSPTAEPTPATPGVTAGATHRSEAPTERERPVAPTARAQFRLGQTATGPMPTATTGLRSTVSATNITSIRPRRTSRVRGAITRVAVVASAMTLAALTGASVLAVLVTMGYLADVDELQGLRENLETRFGTNTESATTADPAVATAVPTTIIELSDLDTDPLGPSTGTIAPTPTIPSEPRTTTQPSTNRANFDELADLNAPPSARFRLGLDLGLG